MGVAVTAWFFVLSEVSKAVPHFKDSPAFPRTKSLALTRIGGEEEEGLERE